MRRLGRTIPSEFVKLDTEVTDADTFINVAMQQRARLNHNILLARGLRRVAWQYCGQDADRNGYTEFINPYLVGVGELQDVFPIFQTRILLSPGTRQCRYWQLASTTHVGTSGNVYPVISNIRAQRPIQNGERISCINDGSGNFVRNAVLTVTVPKPLTFRFGMGLYELALFYGMDAFGANSDVGVAISTASSTQITCATAGVTAAAGVGDLMSFNDTTIQPRVIAERIDGGGTTTFNFLLPWTTNAPTAANTFNVNFGASAQIRNAVLWELPVTDFDAVPKVF